VGCGLWVNRKQQIGDIVSFKINAKSSQLPGFVNIEKMFTFASVLYYSYPERQRDWPDDALTTC
jgi:hypothetical protein